MAQPIENIVSVVIDRQTRVVSQKGFGTPLIAGVHSNFPERIKYVNGLTALGELVDLNFTTSSVVYRMVQAIVSQSPRVEKIAVGRLSPSLAGEITINFSANFVTGNVINLNINGSPISPVTFITDQAATMGNLLAEIENNTDVASAINVGNLVTVEFNLGASASIDGVLVTGGASQATAIVTEVTAAVTVESSLSAITAESDEWYGFAISSSLDADQLSAAAFAESSASPKLFSARTATAGSIASSQADIGALLKAKNYERSFVTYHDVSNEYIDAAILGKILPYEPGSITAKFKTLAGISADNLTAAAITNLQNKNINHFVSTGGLSIYQEGKVAVGEFIDVINGVDWIKSRMQEGVFSVLANANKIPYTDTGVKIIETEIKNILTQAVARNILSDFPKYELFIPKVASQSTADRATRFFPGITWTANLAGAIHKVKINGTVSV